MNLKSPRFARRFHPCLLSAGVAVGLATSLAAQITGTPHVPVLPVADFASPLLLPPTGTLECPQVISFAGPAGSPPVQLSGLRLSPPGGLQAPPAAGTTVVQSYTTGARAMASVDGGSTFQPVAMSAAVQVQVSAVTDSDGTLHYDTEMLQLNLSGGSLPTGMLLRESPTLQSTGTTKIRKVDSSNAYRIDSFFDVFLELSTDGGQSWRPSVAVSHCGLAAPSVEIACAAPTLPPSGSVHRCASAMTFANGAVVRNLALRNPTSSLPPPAPGEAARVVNTAASVTGELSRDGGSSFQPFECAATCSERVANLFDDGAVRYFDTEMLALNLSGGSLPQAVMLRESPTKQSLGRTSLRLAPDNQYRISSFFDIFTEMSLDGGQSWSPCSNGACTCAFARESPSHFFANASFPLPADYACDSDASVSFGASGGVVSDLCFRPSAGRSPLPAAGVSETVALGGSVTGTLAKDGKIVYFPYTLTNTGNADDSFRVSSNSSGESPMECLALSFTTGGPNPVMLRESPSKASLGRTAVRTVPGGYMISSFFDIFLELSTDGGLNWTPADSALHLALRPYAEQENIFASACLPPRDGGFAMGNLESPLDCPNGVLVRNLRLDSFASSQPLPSDGQPQTQSIACNASCEVSSDYGGTWTPVSSLATVPMVVTPLAQAVGSANDWSATRFFQTALLALNLSSGTPGGMMLRESPTKQSLGRCAVQRLSDGSACRIDSFFDVWTEVSLDGGQSWSPASAAAHLELQALPPACFTRTDWLPAPLTLLAPDLDFAVRFPPTDASGNATAKLVRELQFARLRYPNLAMDGAVPPPGPGASATCTATVAVSFDYSPDGGASFARVDCDAALALQYSNMSGGAAGALRALDCEMLACDLAGGSLPTGVMLRESPTLHSTGQTTVRPIAGGCRVSSFFDVFLELSTDSGSTWQAAYSPLHVECRETPQEFPSASATEVSLDSFTVQPGGLPPQCAASAHLNFGEIKVVYSEQKRTLALPPAGQTTTLFDNGTVDFRYSTDDGVSFTPVHCDVFCRYDLKPGKGGRTGESAYDTEMLQLEWSGGNLPSGMKLRESPTLPSHGLMKIRESPTEPSRVSCFFDVFTELSLDGGMSWQPFDLPWHYQFGDHPPATSTPDTAWPPPGQFSLWPNNGDLDFSTAFANGSVMSFFDIFTELGSTRPPLPTTVGDHADIPSTGRCHFHLNAAVGSPPVDVACAAACTVRLTCAGNDSGGTSYFDTEMLQLNLSGGNLPSSMMLRESPTKLSLGKHTLHPAASDGTGGGGAGGSVVDSFFDVFLELSTDGGKTWNPAAAPTRLEFASPAISVSDQNNAALVSGASTVVLSPALTGGTGVTRTFTVHNTGTADLTALSAAFAGPDAQLFSLDSPPAGSLAPSASCTLTVRFNPTAAGAKSALLLLASNDPATSSFAISLSAHALLPDADDDGDGVSNKDELALAAFGLDPLVDNTAAIQALRDSGFFRSSDMHALALGRPVLARNATTGHFHLQLGIRESPTLQSWSALTKFTATSDPATGLFDIDIAPETTKAMFYQVFGGPP